jgi:hypothetical protein
MHFRAEEGGVDYRNALENLNFLLTLISDKLNIIRNSLQLQLLQPLNKIGQFDHRLL